MILLDNWAVHKSSITIIWLNKMNITIYFIPPYLPDFAPVEKCFCQIKRKLGEQCKRETVKLT